jgi:hypothetical protein
MMVFYMLEIGRMTPLVGGPRRVLEGGFNAVTFQSSDVSQRFWWVSQNQTHREEKSA